MSLVRSITTHLLAALFVLPALALASSATINWDTNTTNVDLAGYKVYRGSTECGNGAVLTNLLSTLGIVTTYPDTTIPDTWPLVCYEVTVFLTSGLESEHSNQVSKSFASAPPPSPPPAPTHLKVSKWNGSTWVLLGSI